MSLLNYFLLSDVNKNIKVKAVALKGRSLPLALGLTSHSPSYSPLTAPAAASESTDSSLSLTAYHSLALPNECEIFVEAAIFSDGQRIGTSSFTTYRRSTSLSPSSLPSSLPAASSGGNGSSGGGSGSLPLDQLRFSEWLTFPVKYPDLLPTSRLVFTVWAVSHPTSTTADVETTSTPFPLGGTSLPLFNKRGVLKLGRRRLLLHLGLPGDGSPHSATPHKVGPEEGVGRLEQLIWQYDQKELPCDVKWSTTHIHTHTHIHTWAAPHATQLRPHGTPRTPSHYVTTTTVSSHRSQPRASWSLAVRLLGSTSLHFTA